MKTKQKILVGGMAVAIVGLSFAPVAEAKSLGLRLDTRFHTQDGATAAVPVLRLAVPLGSLELRADWGVFVGDVGDVNLKPLNPFVGAGYNLSLGVMNLNVGAGVAIPALRFSTLADGAAALVAASMDGYWDPWLYQVDTFGIAFPARLDLNIPGIDAMVEGAIYVFLDSGDAREESDFGAQAAGELAFPLAPVLSLGARLQTVYLITQDGTFQTSVEPFVEVGTGPVSLRGGFLLNLDEPAGFSFDSDKFWSVHLGLKVEI